MSSSSLNWSKSRPYSLSKTGVGAKVKGFGIGGNWILSFGGSNILRLCPRGNSAASYAFWTSGGSLNLKLKVRGSVVISYTLTGFSEARSSSKSK